MQSEGAQQSEKRSAQWGSALTLAIMAVIGSVAVAMAFAPRQTVQVDTKIESGIHLTFVMFMPTAQPEGAPAEQYMADVRRAKEKLREYAAASGYQYSTLAVSDHWSTETGLKIVESFGPFDEIILGRNWLNTGIQKYLSHPSARTAVPQVLITLQSIDVKTRPFTYGPLKESMSLLGGREFRSWAAAGFPTAEIASSAASLHADDAAKPYADASTAGAGR